MSNHFEELAKDYCVSYDNFVVTTKNDYDQFITDNRSTGINIAENLLSSFIKQNELKDKIRYLKIPFSNFQRIDCFINFKTTEVFGIEILKNKKININGKRIIITICNDESYTLNYNSVGNKNGTVIAIFTNDILSSHFPVNTMGNKAIEYVVRKVARLDDYQLLTLSARTVEEVSRLHNNVAWNKLPCVDGDTLELFNLDD